MTTDAAGHTWLFLVRHGETFWNADKRLQGQLDTPLNAVGECGPAVG